MNHATIDFETKSKVDIKKAGGWRYSEDPSTDVLCLKFRLPGSDVMGHWDPQFESLESDPLEPLKPLFEWIQKGGLVEAHNAQFEEAIWQNVMVKKYGCPNVRPSQWRCSASKAAALALPRSLEEVGGALQLPIEKDMEGRRLMLKMSKPKKPLKADKEYWLADPDIRLLDDKITFVHDPSGEEFVLWNEDPKDMIRLFEYCTRDVETEEVASEAMLDLSPDELKIWQLDQEINRRGIFCDVPLIEKSLKFIERYSKILTKELQEVTNGEIQTSGQVKKILAWLESEGVFGMDSLAKDKIEEALGWDFLSPNARRVLEIRQLLALTSPKKLKAMLTMAGADHRIRGTLMYHGASTGRWSGKGIQPQNLPRGTVKDVDSCIKALENDSYEDFAHKYPDVLGAVSSCIRGMLRAPEGKKLYCADFSSIESRALFWLADDVGGLEIYHTHGKVYESMAADIYNVKMEDIQKGSFERQLGKQAILGCGYQMGWKTFIDTCAGYGIAITEDQSKMAVTAYRTKFKRVKEFWYEAEAAAIEAVLKPGKVIQNGKVCWKKVGKYLFCKLPSGRKIAYYDPQIRRGETPWGDPKDLLTFMGVDSKIRKWTRQKTYGGKLVENITQAVARDFMAAAMLREEEAGYEIILTVHDELLCESDENFGSLEEFENLMAIVPDWGKGCPIEVEGWEGKRFKK